MGNLIPEELPRSGREGEMASKPVVYSFFISFSDSDFLPSLLYHEKMQRIDRKQNKITGKMLRSMIRGFIIDGVMWKYF